MPDLARIPETVDSAIPNVSAISAAVKRKRRSLAIASTRSDEVRLATRCGAEQRSGTPSPPLEPIATHPLARAAHTDASGLGRRGQRPALTHDPLREPAPTMPTESRVTVKLHPASSLDWGAWQLPASKETRMNQRAQELQRARTPRPKLGQRRSSTQRSNR